MNPETRRHADEINSVAVATIIQSKVDGKDAKAEQLKEDQKKSDIDRKHPPTASSGGDHTAQPLPPIEPTGTPFHRGPIHRQQRGGEGVKLYWGEVWQYTVGVRKWTALCLFAPARGGRPRALKGVILLNGVQILPGAQANCLQQCQCQKKSNPHYCLIGLHLRNARYHKYDADKQAFRPKPELPSKDKTDTNFDQDLYCASSCTCCGYGYNLAIRTRNGWIQGIEDAIPDAFPGARISEAGLYRWVFGLLAVVVLLAALARTWYCQHNAPPLPDDARKLFECQFGIDGDQSWIPNDVFNALAVATAAYTGDPKEYFHAIGDGRVFHTLDPRTVQVLNFSMPDGDSLRNEQIMTINSTNGALFIGIPGTNSTSDIITDLHANQLMNEWQGSTHAGFLRKAAAIPIQSLVDAFAGGQRLVCGAHSLGVPVCSLLLLRIKAQVPAHANWPTDPFKVIGFGSPLFADAVMADALHKRGDAVRLHFFINEDDVVPRLLSIKADWTLGYLSAFGSFLSAIPSAIGTISGGAQDAARGLLDVVRQWGGHTFDPQYQAVGNFYLLSSAGRCPATPLRSTLAAHQTTLKERLQFPSKLQLHHIQQHYLVNYVDLFGRLQLDIVKSDRGSGCILWPELPICRRS